MKFADIKPFTRSANYKVTVSWKSLERSLSEYIDQGLEIDPDFQRGHVWSDGQRSRYVEYILREGPSSRDLYANHTHWDSGQDGWFCLVDGKQRLTATLMFIRGEIPAFNHYISEYEDAMRITSANFTLHINNLRTRAEVLQWYLDLNAGGVVHTDDEIEHVKALLDQELK